jgi:hypothetical protein
MSAVEEISEALGFAPQHIYALVATAESQYFTISIPKNGDTESFRQLDIPTSALKGVQKQILKAVLRDVEVHKSAYAYVRSRDIVSAARRLCGNYSLLKIDIADFFPSITSRRIFGVFKSIGYSDSISYILTTLCTYKGSIPQGAPTSPALSNIIFRKLDARLEKLAQSWDLEYTRYSDDMFFCHDRNFNHPKFLELVVGQIESSGFLINAAKTRFYPRGAPRKTLGLLTHGSSPALPGPVRRKIRVAFHKGSRNIGWGQENIEFLRGTLEWYKCVYGRDSRYFEYKAVVDTIERVKLHISYQSV